MTTMEVLAVIVALLAIVAIAGFLRYRVSSSVNIRGPKGTGLQFRGTDERQVTTLGEDIRAGRDVAVSDTGGVGAQGRRIDTDGSVTISHQRSPTESNPAQRDPKA